MVAPGQDLICVCGDPFSEHRPVMMSVPMTWRPPIYEMPSTAPIAEPSYSATYDRHECHCGCTIPTVDYQANP